MLFKQLRIPSKAVSVETPSHSMCSHNLKLIIQIFVPHLSSLTQVNILAILWQVSTFMKVEHAYMQPILAFNHVFLKSNRQKYISLETILFQYIKNMDFEVQQTWIFTQILTFTSYLILNVLNSSFLILKQEKNRTLVMLLWDAEPVLQQNTPCDTPQHSNALQILYTGMKRYFLTQLGRME